jgi:prephenate dehydratase
MTSAAVRPVVAFQGEHGAFSEDAACAMLGAQIELRPYSTLPAVFTAVESGEVECAVVPIENSLGGSINQTYDLLLKHSLVIGNEYGLRVRHCLMALPGTKEDAIKRVYSHPQALAQCERYLELHPAWEIHALYDTAGSARMIAREKLEGAAAVACSRAAGVYGLQILAEGIEDNTQNYTRFIQIRREPVSRSERDKTSIVFGAKNNAGALFKSLAVFAIRDINLTKLESRPSKDAPWQYVFYLDFDGNAADEPCARALTHLEEISHFVKLLGSYPRNC